MRTRSRAAWRAAAVAPLVATLASGCLFAGERLCADDEYSALFLEDGRLMGGTCVPSGEEPPAGYVRWPRDLEPTYLRDRDDALAEFQRRLDSGAADVTPAPTPS